MVFITAANKAAAEIVGRATYSQLDFGERGPLNPQHVGCAFDVWKSDNAMPTHDFAEEVQRLLNEELGYVW